LAAEAKVNIFVLKSQYELQLMLINNNNFPAD